MLARMRDAIMPASEADTPLGLLRQEDYDRVAESLTTLGVIKAAPNFRQFTRADRPAAGGAQ